jgi:HEAT repeat protein/transcriptional regulator with XRE-family HTH domain
MARSGSFAVPRPLALFCARLKRLQEAAGVTQARLAAAVGRSPQQMSAVLNGQIRRPPDWTVVEQVVKTCLARASEAGRLVPPDLSDLEDWRRRYFDLEQDLEAEGPHRGVSARQRNLRGVSAADGEGQASDDEFQQGLIALLEGLEAWARAGRLPAYLPADVDTVTLSRAVRVREGIRRGQVPSVAVGANELPVERMGDGDQRLWSEVVAAHRRLMVLADPGLGKSWLIRAETRRLCQDALARLADDSRAEVIIPVPLRCDQLAEAPGVDLAEKASAYLAAQGLVPGRLLTRLATQIRDGRAVVLLDALDELTPVQDGPLRTLVRAWADQAGGQGRCVITSRLAGYTGSPVPGAYEVELQAFTFHDIRAVVTAWNLSPAATSRLLDQVADPAIAAMARIPLLLALMCSLAGSPGEQELPRSRGQLLDRILRWFLTRSHRSPDDPGVSALDDFSVGALLELLGPLAFRFATDPDGWIDLMPQDRLLKEIRAAGAPFADLGRPAAVVLQELSVRAGIMVPAGDPSAGRSPEYLFFHRAVAEYLVAHHLTSLPEPQWLAIIEQHRWFDPDWAEVIPMLGERLALAAARRLIQYLAATEADPFHHSLLAAARIWGTRPDADLLLPARYADELAGRLAELFHHPASRPAVVSRLDTNLYLPQPLLTPLITLLSDPDPDVREDAARVLWDRGGPDVSEALLSLVSDPDRGVRWACVCALGEREGPGVPEALLGRLSDPDPDLQFRAAEALADQKEPSVTEALLSLISDSDRDARVRRLAAWALAQREGPGVTEALLNLTSDPDQDTRREAARALARRRGLGATEALLSLPNHPDSEVRRVAIQALAGREGQGVTEALLSLASRPDPDGAPWPDPDGVRWAATWALARREGPGVIQALLSLLSDPDESVRHEAAGALARRGEPEVTEALLTLVNDPDHDVTGKQAAARALIGREGLGVTEALLTLVKDPDGRVREAACKALAGREGPGVTQALLTLVNDPDERVREAACKALAGREGPGVTQALLTLVNDPGLSVREAACKALAGREGPSVTQALLTLLNNPDEFTFTRWEAAEALARREGSDVTQALLSALNDANPLMPQHAVRALADRDGSDVTKALLGMVSDAPQGIRRPWHVLKSIWETIRWEAMNALAGRKGPGVTEALLRLLSDPDRHVRRAAARALTGRKGTEVTKALLGRLNDPDKNVREAAAEALSDRNVLRELVDWVRANRESGQIDMPVVIRLAKQLVTRNYRSINSPEKQSLLAAMAWLTGAK